jgi:hypothetical protein
MPPTNFEQLADRPEYRELTERLREWVRLHDRYTIDPRRIALDFPRVRSEQLAIALQLLVKAGVLRQVYKVLTPAGVLADGEFEDPRSIPLRLQDRFHRYFETSEAEIVPVFKAQRP